MNYVELPGCRANSVAEVAEDLERLSIENGDLLSDSVGDVDEPLFLV